MRRIVRWTWPALRLSAVGVTLPAPVLAVFAMFSVQLGAALSTGLFATVSPSGTVWLRLSFAGVVLLVVCRPRLAALNGQARRSVLLLGVASAVMTLAFIEAVARVPLGIAVAVEFLGPLGVAAVRSPRRSALTWPALALVGVLALTEPWKGEVDIDGVLFAALAATGWAAYIVLTQRVGAALPGMQGVALSIPLAALLAVPFGAPDALAGLTPLIALQCLGLALLLPLLPYLLELQALRRMTASAFGTLMAVEPAIAVLIGVVVLTQVPALWQLAGMALVVTAGVGAEQQARRHTSTPLAVGTA